MPSGIYRRTENQKKLLSEMRKGQTPWNKGKEMSDEFREKVSLGMMGRKAPKTAFKKGMIPWNKDMGKSYTESYRQRRIFRNTIQKQVFERDDYTCQLCGIRGGDLQVDHIQSWAEYVEQRFSMDNCRTVCAGCHYQVTFGKPMPATLKGWGHNLLRKGVQGL